MKYKISYTLILREKITVSPHTGKPYKNPRTIRQWIELQEYDKSSQNLETALKGAKERASIKGWRLDSVIEEV